MNPTPLATAARDLKDRLGWTELTPTPASMEAVIRVGMDLADLVAALAVAVADLQTAQAAVRLEALTAPAELEEEPDPEELAELRAALQDLAEPLEEHGP